MDEDLRKGLEEARLRLGSSGRPAALTGAGVSAESGVPVFRGDDGLWNNYRPEELATPEAFARDPELVWRWYDWRRGLISPLEPNGAHYALAELERRHPRFRLITQNVDGLHTLAGSARVTELHGSVWTVRCTGCGDERENRDVPIDIPPRCGCGSLLRPGVVWFGEALPPGTIEAAFSAASNCDFFIVAGTSGVVQPAASLAAMAKDAGAFVVEVNPDPTPLSPVVHVRLAGRAAEVLRGLIE